MRTLFTCLLLSVAPLAGQESTPSSDPPRTVVVNEFEELTPEARRAIRDGVAWLADEQGERSGAWQSEPKNYRMSVTALAGLALLANGNTPHAGRHSRQVRRAIEFVLRSEWGPDTNWPGLLFDIPQGSESAEDRPLHGHGFALLFLGSAYGNTRDPKLRERMHDCLSHAARLTERTISADGGWFYHPGQNRDEGSVTITQIQGMRAAHNSGVFVDAKTIDRAVQYIKNSQEPDGGVRYMLRWGRTSSALTAAGISVLHGAGEYRSEPVERGYKYLRKQLKVDSDAPFFFYTHLYAVQAMFQRGGPEWRAYFPRIRDTLLDLRRNRPYWQNEHSYGGGPAYETAMALLILQVPMRYLPIFQR